MNLRIPVLSSELTYPIVNNRTHALRNFTLKCRMHQAHAHNLSIVLYHFREVYHLLFHQLQIHPMVKISFQVLLSPSRPPLIFVLPTVMISQRSQVKIYFLFDILIRIAKNNIIYFFFVSLNYVNNE